MQFLNKLGRKFRQENAAGCNGPGVQELRSSIARLCSGFSNFYQELVPYPVGHNGIISTMFCTKTCVCGFGTIIGTAKFVWRRPLAKLRLQKCCAAVLCCSFVMSGDLSESEYSFPSDSPWNTDDFDNPLEGDG
eukprot:1493379-Rhodomonas_salina.3